MLPFRRGDRARYGVWKYWGVTRIYSCGSGTTSDGDTEFLGNISATAAAIASNFGSADSLSSLWFGWYYHQHHCKHRRRCLNRWYFLSINISDNNSHTMSSSETTAANSATEGIMDVEQQRLAAVANAATQAALLTLMPPSSGVEPSKSSSHLSLTYHRRQLSGGASPSLPASLSRAPPPSLSSVGLSTSMHGLTCTMSTQQTQQQSSSKGQQHYSITHHYPISDPESVPCVWVLLQFIGYLMGL